MRIGIDARILHHRTAGISWYTRRLLHALSLIDSENEYVLLQHRRDLEPIVHAPNFRRVALYAPVHHRFEQLPLSAETRRLGLDMIHSPDFIPPLRNRIPAVITVHDLAFIRFPNFVTKESARYYGQTELAVRRANRIIAVSNATRVDLVTMLGAPEAKINVIHEAADPLYQPIPPAEAQATLSEAGIDVPDSFILFVGTIEPRKNLGALLRAYQLLRRNYDVAQPLVLVGAEGWLHQDVHELVQSLELSDRVHFLGNVPDNRYLRALYNLASLLAHPAYYEGFGLPPLEAMACGTPVVCSNAGSLPEVVGDAALLVPPTEIESWAVSIHRLLADDALRNDLRRKGLARASTFSWEKAAVATLETYRQAVAGRR
ncbi:MAG: glycosyltransferase family 4 protein [Caldilineales bacterium]|nr:glycosyltransferase family 4 protein [Caldilineales bacterium]